MHRTCVVANVKRLVQWVPPPHSRVVQVQVVVGVVISQAVPHRAAVEGLPRLADEVEQVLLSDGLVRFTPVVLSFHANFLLKAPTAGSDKHVAVVVASRWNAKMNSCEFKIRNTWGKGCQVYRPPYDDSDHCDKGSVWVSSAEVDRTTYSSMFVDVVSSTQ